MNRTIQELSRKVQVPERSQILPKLVNEALHSGFPSHRDEDFQISRHENIFSRFVLQVLAHGV